MESPIDYAAILSDANATPDDKAKALRERAIAKGKAGDFDGALADVDATLLLAGTSPVWKSAPRITRGWLLGKRGDAAGALAEYDAVLALPDAPAEQKAKARVNRGAALARIGDVPGALAEYDAVLAMPDAPAELKAMARVNRGNALGRKGDAPGALAEYDAVLAMPDAPADVKARARLGRGISLERSEDTAGALAEYETVLAMPDATADVKAVARSVRDVIAVPPPLRSTADRATLEAASDKTTVSGERPEARMLAKLSQAATDRYTKYGNEPGSGEDDVLAILRGWSSTVPVVRGTATHLSGGGYFLKWRGQGIVIDPGHDFIDNFHGQGFRLREVQAVVVSHNHGDHNQDLKALDDLFYEMWKRNLKSKPNPYGYALIWDRQTAEQVQFDSAGTDFRRVVQYDHGRREVGMDCTITVSLPATLHTQFDYCRVKHTRDVPDGAGVKLTLLPVGSKPGLVVGYTGDTEYFDDLALNDHLGGCDLLIAHISQPDEKEMTDDAHTKRGHLGYNGVVQLLGKFNPKPKLTLIGEFWAGLADLRIDLVQGLRQRTGLKAILPTSVGMRIRLPDLAVRCTECGQFSPPEAVRVSPAQQPYGPLSYLCPQCSL